MDAGNVCTLAHDRHGKNRGHRLACHVPVLDFMGATSTAVAMRIPLVYGMVAVALLLPACVGRQQQLQV